MFRRILHTTILAALLILGSSHGASAGVPDASDQTHDAAGPAQLIRAQGAAVGASLPAHGVVTWLLAGADPDSRSGRPGPARTPGHVRLNPLPPAAYPSHHPSHDDTRTRLTRAGLHSSSLGTPPPQS